VSRCHLIHGRHSFRTMQAPRTSESKILTYAQSVSSGRRPFGVVSKEDLPCHRCAFVPFSESVPAQLTLPQSPKSGSNHYKMGDRPVVDTNPHGRCKSDYLDRVRCVNGRMDTISGRYAAREAGTWCLFRSYPVLNENLPRYSLRVWPCWRTTVSSRCA